MKTRTRGGLIVEDIKIGDIHYEFEYGVGIKSEVMTLPVQDDNGDWSWKSKNLTTLKEIDYGVFKGGGCYSVKLYDYMAYTVTTWV